MDGETSLPSGYGWRRGAGRDQGLLRQWWQATLQETELDLVSMDPLQEMIEQLFDPPRTPCWWIVTLESDDPVACVWAGISIDPVTAQRLGYIFLLRVDPNHRQQGLGQALISRVEEWAHQEGLIGLGLHVSVENQVALDLYHKAGFLIQGFWLQKRFEIQEIQGSD